MAYTSEKALAAPIRPQSKGSSTMGVKKSTVWIIARPSPPGSAYTAASSPVAGETTTSGGYSVGVRRPRTWARSLGASLHAQPAPWLNLVSRTSSRMVSATRARIRLSPETAPVTPEVRDRHSLAKSGHTRPGQFDVWTTGTQSGISRAICRLGGRPHRPEKGRSPMSLARSFSGSAHARHVSRYITHAERWHGRMSRRAFIRTAAGAAGVALTSGVWMPELAWAAKGSTEPSPIPGGTELPFGFFHFFFP